MAATDRKIDQRDSAEAPHGNNKPATDVPAAVAVAPMTDRPITDIPAFCRGDFLTDPIK